MRFVNELWIGSWWISWKNALHVVDHAFIESSYWDQRKKIFFDLDSANKNPL
jgi:hypothetical protein